MIFYFFSSGNSCRTGSGRSQVRGDSGARSAATMGETPRPPASPCLLPGGQWGARGTPGHGVPQDLAVASHGSPMGTGSPRCQHFSRSGHGQRGDEEEGTRRGRASGSFFKVMNGRKRKWQGGQGKEKGADFQIKFSGHLNKHLSSRSDGGRVVCDPGKAGSVSTGHFK